MTIHIDELTVDRKSTAWVWASRIAPQLTSASQTITRVTKHTGHLREH